MEIQKTILDQVVLLHPRGNILSSADANRIHQMVHEELEANRRNFILDMSDVLLINSSGVGILIGTLTAARNQDGDVKLVSVNEKVANIFKMMHLDQVFSLYDTIEEARRSFIALN